MWQQFLLIVIFGQAPAQATANPAQSTCVTCHLDMGDPYAAPVKLSAQDIHFQKGLSCDSCHGGDPARTDPAESMDPRRGFVGKPAGKQIGSFCAGCHAKIDFMRKFNPQARVDQYSEYLTSVHGKKNQAGDPSAATCIDCHGAHGVRAVNNPNSPVYPTNVAETCGRCHSDSKRMGAYGIRTDQQALYTGSVHGEALIRQRDLAAPTCNDCHGNHGATPPGVDSVANVCGQCHVTQWDLFGKSPHSKVFAENDWPACVTCHRNHDIQRTSDTMIGVGQPSLCLNCHAQGSAGYQAAQQMKSGLADLQSRLAAASDVLEQAERSGMEVSRPIFQLSEARDRLILARVEIHAFNAAALQKIADEGGRIAADSEQSGRQALAELAYRRKGLAVSALILVCMIGLLLLKIRQLKA